MHIRPRGWLFFLALLVACNLPSTVPPTTTPSPSPMPTPTSGVTPTPEVLPLSTPVVDWPNEIVALQEALFLGDYDRVNVESAPFIAHPDAMVRQEALWLRARALYARGEYATALNVILELLRANPPTARLAQAYFLAGEIYRNLGRYADAAAAYRTYLLLRPGVLDAFVQERLGDALLQSGDAVSALAAYEVARGVTSPENEALLLLKMARTRHQIGDYGGAIALCDQVIQESDNDYLKAEAEYVAAEAHEALGQMAQAYERLRRAVHEYPRAYYAYQALVKLLDRNVVVDDLDRGIVDYYAGQYGIALEALNRYQLTHPENDGTADFYRALTLEAMGRYEEALSTWDAFILRYPSHPRWSEAWENKADLFASARGDPNGAANVLLQLASTRRGDAKAAEWLFRAARFYERASNFESAIAVWESIVNYYPSSPQAEEGLFQAALLRYRKKDYASALTAFQRLLLTATSAEGSARAYFWIGKTAQALGNAQEAAQAWRQAQALDPTGYYSERARDLLLGRAPFSTTRPANLEINWEEERRAAAAWLRLTLNYPADLDLTSLANLEQDARWVRGNELWALGRYDEAHAEWDALREAVAGDAAASFRLIEAFRRLRVYDLAILSARQVLDLAGLNDAASSLRAPAYFTHVRYGPYYAEVLAPLAEQEGVDVLLLFSLVRQESLFRPSALSSAGAHGLMQIIPSTADSLARQIGWPPNFTTADLARPVVNLRLGVHYLASQRNYFGGDLYAALAAYNAGPGNAAEWQRLAAGDPDLFVEVIRFQETRRYLRQIYEIYIIYRTLYAADST
ncbi:MAG: tetratricopeptide repeat protein [Anaerolineales bacterium]